MATAGRPTKLTPETQKAVCKALAGGNTRADAARLAGVGYRTFLTWMRQGAETESGPFRQFRRAVRAAETEAAAHHVAVIHKAARKDWHASAWWLERRRSKRFGRVKRHEHTGKDGGAIQNEHTVTLTDEQLRAALDNLDARLAARGAVAPLNGAVHGDGPLPR